MCLSSCARAGALGQGEWVHTYIDKNKIEVKGFLATALVDMYSKGGSIDKALQVFNSTLKKDVSTWNAIIEGLSSHGYGEDGLRFFDTMTKNGFKPNAVTFVIVLSACSHAGLLNKGRQIFNLMVYGYGLEPKIEHYGCMVDLFGRAGLLEEAEDIIRRVPLMDALVLWESLLSACRNLGDIGLAEMVVKRLVEVNPEDSSCYIQLSNVYASAGRWNDVREVREMMRVRGVRKKPGCSSIEVDGIVHEFFVGDCITNTE